MCARSFGQDTQFRAKIQQTLTTGRTDWILISDDNGEALSPNDHPVACLSRSLPAVTATSTSPPAISQRNSTQVGTETPACYASWPKTERVFSVFFILFFQPACPALLASFSHPFSSIMVAAFSGKACRSCRAGCLAGCVISTATKKKPSLQYRSRSLSLSPSANHFTLRKLASCWRLVYCADWKSSALGRDHALLSARREKIDINPQRSKLK